jgi:hypothetical protein
MNRTLKQNVIWFLDNLKLQIEDISLEKRGINPEIYFDTGDVRGALLGMESFFNPDRGFDIKTFFEEKTLVQCLASGGWLGAIQLLPPHQAEFLNLLNLDFGVAVEKEPEARAQEFLYRIKVAGAINNELLSVQQNHEANIVEFVREHASSAINLFKAVQCIRGVNWQRRLANWRATGRLRLKSVDFNYSTILNSPVFQNIKKSFDLKRPKTTVNNFADAVAVVLLIYLVSSYKKGETDKIPRLFVPTHLFREAIIDAGVLPLLQYKTDPGTPSSVLRDADYFKFISIFRSSPKDFTSGERIDDLDSELELLNELRKQIEDILKAQEPLTPDTVDKIFFSGKPLSLIIQELQQLSFFENVWLPFSAKIEAQDALRELSEVTQQFKSSKYEEAVETAIEETKQALEDNVKGYRLVSSLWTHLEHASTNMHASLRKDPGRPLDVFWDLGLLRFDFPQSTHARISAVLEALFSGDEDAEREARISVVTAYYAYSTHGDSIKKEGDLALAAAVLWVAKMDREIIKLLERVFAETHYCLKIVYAAATFRLNQRLKQGENVVELLRKEYDETKDKNRCLGLSVGLAYLNFHLWYRLSFGPLWRPLPVVRTKAPQEVGHRLITDAINFAKSAYESGEDISFQKYVYALNQYLYYLVEGGDDSQLGQMKVLAEQLADFKGDRSLWQYRFEDTLARYFHRLATSVDSLEKKITLMKIAQRHIEAAGEGPYKDEEVESYRTRFDIQFADLTATQ